MAIAFSDMLTSFLALLGSRVDDLLLFEPGRNVLIFAYLLVCWSLTIYMSRYLPEVVGFLFMFGFLVDDLLLLKPGRKVYNGLSAFRVESHSMP